MEPVFTFAQRLEELKRIRGFNNTDLARICGIDKSNITRYCKGDYKAKQDVIYRMAEKLNINEAWLMGYDVPMEKQPDPKKDFKRTWLGLQHFVATKNEPALDEDKLNIELIKRLTKLTPEELQRVDAFVQGILASR